MSYDKCATLPDQIAWLEQVGYEDVECFFSFVPLRGLWWVETHLRMVVEIPKSPAIIRISVELSGPHLASNTVDSP